MSSGDEIYDEIDKFHKNRETRIGVNFADNDEGPGTQSVFPVLASSDEEDDNEKDISSKWQKFVNDADMEDDFDLENSENLDENINREDWGPKKSLYYNSDSAFYQKQGKKEKGPRLTKAEKEEQMKELMKMEEEEALLLQKQLMQELKDEDFGPTFLTEMINQQIEPQSDTQNVISDTVLPQRLHRDTSEMTRKEKVALLKRESPEFIPWCKESKEFWNELNNELHPLLNAYMYYRLTNFNDLRGICELKNRDKFIIEDESFLDDIFSGVERNLISLLAIKRHLLGVYLINFGYYLYAKTHNFPGEKISGNSFNVYAHPVMLRLQTFRKFITYVSELINSHHASSFTTLKESCFTSSSISNVFRDEKLEITFNKDDKNDYFSSLAELDIQIFGYHPSKLPDTLTHIAQPELRSYSNNRIDPRLHSLDQGEEGRIIKTNDKTQLPWTLLTGRKKQHSKKSKHVQFAPDVDEIQKMNGTTSDKNNIDPFVSRGAFGIDDSSKRPINYEIAKNKGLTPKRKKEYRNPRVKHKIRYKKALIKQKSQVRIPRKEINKYSGEKTGIKINLRRSTKIK